MEPEISPPWNKGRTVGKKLAFSLDQINEITNHLKSSKQWHDLCLLMLGIDTMLRCSDLLKLKVSDVMTQYGEVRGTFSLRQTKTAHGVFPVLTPTTQEACQRWISYSGKSGADFLFTGKKTDTSSPISPCVYRCLVKRWAELINLDPVFLQHSFTSPEQAGLYVWPRGQDRISHPASGSQNSTSHNGILGYYPA